MIAPLHTNLPKMRLTPLRWLVALFLAAPVEAAQGPIPPCAGSVVPTYAALGSAPQVRVWEPQDVTTAWSPPACLGWPASERAVLVAAAGRLRSAHVEGLLGRIAEISALPEIRFWSVMRDAWQPLFETASAVTGPDGRTHRADFSPAELVTGARLYMLADQNDPLDAIVQRLTVIERGSDRLIVELENVSSGHMALMEILPVGGARTLFYMQREVDDIWTFYSLIRVADRAPDLLSPPRASWINRAAALYRWFAGIPTDQEPPPAR